MNEFRIEKDAMGEVEIPGSALWGASTQRAIDNFPISGRTLPIAYIQKLALIKKIAAETNARLGILDKKIACAIFSSASEIIKGNHNDQFPIDVFQTGSGTSTNMNLNEVIANLTGHFGYYRVDLARHHGRTRLQCWKFDLGKPESGPRCQKPP